LLDRFKILTQQNKGDKMEKSGHKDVASSIRLCRSIVEDAESILTSLPEEETNIPTWWTNKLAICYAYMNSLRDYAYYSENGITKQRDDNESEDDESDEDEDQIKIGDYVTKHFDICPSAVALYSNILDKTDMIHLVVESLMLHDLLFKLEKFAISMGVADADILDKAQRYADMIMMLAEEMNLQSEHDYIEDTHMAKFKELAVPNIDESMIPPSARMVQYAT
jgi:hypothetical protein